MEGFGRELSTCWVGTNNTVIFFLHDSLGNIKKHVGVEHEWVFTWLRSFKGFTIVVYRYDKYFPFL